MIHSIVTLFVQSYACCDYNKKQAMNICHTLYLYMLMQVPQQEEGGKGTQGKRQLLQNETEH